MFEDNLLDNILDEGLIDQLSLAQDTDGSIITVVGVGGAGGNAVNYMWNVGIRNVRFMVCNTDQQALSRSLVDNVICLGDGLGAGNDPAKGRNAAIESSDVILERFKTLNTRMIFIAAGMGGGTGTGAAPVIARLAKEMGILTVAIVTSPLLVEGKIRYEQAMNGIKELRDTVDSLLIINNENIQNLYIDNLSMTQAFSKANEILSCAAKGISEIITVTSAFVNVDFADVSKVMRNSGRAHMSVVSASGADRAKIVARESLTSPLLDQNSILGAKDILLNIASEDIDSIGFDEVMTILNYVQEHARVVNETGAVGTANIIWGASSKPELGDKIEVVLVATGFENEEEEFDEYYRAKMLEMTDPNSPFERMNLGRISSKREKRVDQDEITPRISPLANGESVVLKEREPRYPNILTLLKTPAYKARKAELRTESAPSTPPPPTKVEEEIDLGDNTLFD